MTPDQEKLVSRRTLAKGAMWAVPTVAIVTGSPAFAASAACRPENLKKIQDYFDGYIRSIPDQTGVTLEINYYQPVGSANGFLGNSYLNVKNVGSKALKLGSPNYKYDLIYKMQLVNLPDHGRVTDHRAFTTSSSYYGYEDLKGNYLGTIGKGAGNTTTETTFSPGDTQAILLRMLRDDQPAGKEFDLNLQWQDGITAGGRLNTKVVLEPMGIAAPLATDVQKATGVELTDSSPCYPAFLQAVQNYYATGNKFGGIKYVMRGPNPPSSGKDVPLVNGRADSSTIGDFAFFGAKGDGIY
ncbi:hypothetical protein [Devriesea agamarum]|uniref:hypothetical protein n=1 Tax=Devriesea agamarum TaxID=472569 RepID=UPI00071D7163|nr:hypothetical protein [Devriesea agamarum]